ncbi:unnamed protein product [Urochloa humidicola]
MAPPQTCGPSELLEAAANGDLQLFKRTARALHTGKGRLRDAVEAVKNTGAGPLQVAAGSGRMAVCAYLVEELRLDVNAHDKSGGLLRPVSLPSSRWRKILSFLGYMVTSVSLLSCNVKFALR